MTGSEATDLRLRSTWRVAATVFAVFWFVVGGAAVAMFAWLGAWALVVIGGAAVAVVFLVAVRAARIRLEIQSDRLRVANLFRTTVIRKGDVVVLGIGPSANPFGPFETIVVETGSAKVAIEALAAPAGNHEQFDAVLDRLERWLRGR